MRRPLEHGLGLQGSKLLASITSERGTSRERWRGSRPPTGLTCHSLLGDFPGSQGLGDIPIVKPEPPVVSTRLTDVPQAPGPATPILYKL